MMEKSSIDVMRNRDIDNALNRYITKKTFEFRIMEHPLKALERTSFCNEAPIIEQIIPKNGKKTYRKKHHL